MLYLNNLSILEFLLGFMPEHFQLIFYHPKKKNKEKGLKYKISNEVSSVDEFYS